MLIGARLIPLMFPMLAPSVEGADIIAFDIGLGGEGEGAMPPPDLLAAEPEEELDESEEEPPEEIGVDPAVAPPCWWPADPEPVDAAASPAPTMIEADGATAIPEVDVPTEAATRLPVEAEIAKGAVPTTDAPQPSDQTPDAQTQAEPSPESQPDPQSDSQGDRPEPPDPKRADPAPVEPAALEPTPPEAARPEPQRSPERQPSVDEVARRSAPAEAPPGPVEPAPQTDGLGDIQVMFEREGDATRITLVAERAETVDLMRRHADQLQNELAREGLADADLNFAEREQNRRHDGEAAATEAAPAIALPPSVPMSGLDLRL
ncbi:flagellar hook-length control protein FliK [Falsirhodobacter xinxiangensis]|uniref:flagellar hook-length control protein FliK n=1 Tax=Falsirhodobacter xinxiangensis TaxID=2530049 RepID=UPI0010AAD888|nr:flagellar hook-length control protein FliK [Rhodobacter xinxiangensis]